MEISMDYQKKLTKAMADLDEEHVLKYVQLMLSSGYSHAAIRKCLTEGSEEVGSYFEDGEYFIADLIVSGMIYQHALALMIPPFESGDPRPVGRAVIGVVEGDIHDIGKEIIVSLLRAERFDVIDLGVDVKPERFVHALRTYHPDIILLSGLLSDSVAAVSRTMQALNAESERRKTIIFVGGQCASEQLCTQTGADSWGYDTIYTIEFCKKAIEKSHAKSDEKTTSVQHHL